MTAQEMLKILKGTEEERRNLFNALLEKGLGEEGLTDDELPILETLKKEFIKPKKQVVLMEAAIQGTAGIKL